MLKRLFLFSLLVCGIMLCAKAQQSAKEELQRFQKESQQLLKEVTELNNELASIKKNKKAALGAYAMIQNKIAKRESLINSINREIRALEETAYQDELEVNHLKKELDTLKQQYAKSIVFAYKNRSSYEYLNFIFSAGSFNDAIKRITYLKSYRQYRETQAQTILKTQDLLQQKIGEFNNTKKEKTATLLKQNDQLKVLEEDKKEKSLAAQQLKAQEKDVQAQIKKMEKMRADLRRAMAAAIRRAAEEADRKAKALAKQKADEEKRKLQQPNEAIAKNNNITNNNPVAVNKPSTKSNEVLAPSKPAPAREYNAFESTPEGLTRSLNFENNRGSLPWPVSGGVVIGHFGTEKYGDTKLNVANDGIVIATNVGTTVKCVADGEVINVFDLGDDQAVMIQHGKYFTTYSNLGSVSVGKGDAVKAGSVIGKAGANLSGEGELMFYIVNNKQQFQNPESWLKRR
jgi:septal ring factor EnvC (AmiA/AmiB activator)